MLEAFANLELVATTSVIVTAVASWSGKQNSHCRLTGEHSKPPVAEIEVENQHRKLNP